MWKAKDLEEKIQTLIDDGVSPWGDGWYALEELDHSWRSDNKENDTIDVPGFGTIEFVEQFGGEGQGDSRWVIFKIGDRYFQMNAYYDSWSGTDWDGPFEEVKPVQVTKTEYRGI